MKILQRLTNILCPLRLNMAKLSGGGSLRNIIAVLGDISWPLIGWCWSSEPSDWSGSAHTWGAYFTFPQLCNYRYQHLIKSHRFDGHILYNTIIFDLANCLFSLRLVYSLYLLLSQSASCRVLRYLCWNYLICADIKCGIIQREGY